MSICSLHQPLYQINYLQTINVSVSQCLTQSTKLHTLIIIMLFLFLLVDEIDQEFELLRVLNLISEESVKAKTCTHLSITQGILYLGTK